MRDFNIIFLEDNLVTERSFLSAKSMAQYRRRKGIKQCEIYYRNKRVLPYKNGFISYDNILSLIKGFDYSVDAPDPSNGLKNEK